MKLWTSAVNFLYEIRYRISDSWWDLKSRYWTFRDRLICRFRGHMPTNDSLMGWEPEDCLYCDRCGEDL